MSSISNFPALSVLQASLAQAASGLSLEASQDALQRIRQVPGFSGLSDAGSLLSQDTVARLTVAPSLFDSLERAFPAFGRLTALWEVSALPALDDRLETVASLLDLRRGVQVFVATDPFPVPDGFLTGTMTLLEKNMSRALKDELAWPHQIELKTLGAFSVSVRKAFDAREDHLTARQRAHLMRLSSLMNGAAFSLCRPLEAERLAPLQALKIAALLETLYGLGYGNDRALAAAERLYKLPRMWTKMDPSAREAAFRLAAEIANELLSEVRAGDESLKLPGRGVGATGGAAAALREQADSLGFS